ncbi:unnamed protein product [Bursaphelenchus xylophilus]|uniref:(pine wood nematode) hypothetical protein n=1 Tax=Bursaphelenchus xylophilus TaxID=6326 RepID=A0A1I7SUH1_BURXY|nr:unnamed protein product [Bursaphelenchus xylophilus]CAG9107136.1 unnamed protein product [Bursaphelenchus xylophilus]
MKILIASDSHCGYGEIKQYLYEDSFRSFEEVLQKAKENECDFILLGGDLFHESEPSRRTQIRLMRLIREYCMSGPKTSLKVTSNGEDNFGVFQFKTANIDDENLTVSLPIFTINGNHDDFCCTDSTAVDIYHEAGVLNIFGRFKDIKYFDVNPVLLEKENPDGSVSKVALYGIGSQRDDRLARAFMSGHVRFNKPSNYEEYLNILVLHQNRPQRSTLRSTGSYISTDLLPGFIDLVVWGHEHASIIEPQRVVAKDGQEFLILQPGSTTATSLCPDEAMQKHCFLLDSQYDIREPVITPLKLETCRQIFYEDIDLDGLHLVPPCESVRTSEMEDEQYLHRRMNEILRQAELSRTASQPELPLVRFRLHYVGAWRRIPPIMPRRFGRLYRDKVANANEIIWVHRSKDPDVVKGVKTQNIKKELIPANVELVVQEHFNNVRGEDQLAVLEVDVLNKALEAYGSNESYSFANINKRTKGTLREHIKMYVNKITELTSGSEDDMTIRNYQDFEERVGKVIYSKYAEKANVKKEVEAMDVKEEQKENISDDDIEWLDK